MESLDQRTELEKALDFATVGTILLQPEIDKIIRTEVDRNQALRQQFKRKGGSGDKWQLRRRTAYGTAVFVNDTDSPSEVQSTFAAAAAGEFAYKTILFPGAVTRFLQATGKTFGDLLQEEIQAGIVSVRLEEEDKLVNGSISVDAKQFDGLRILIVAGQLKDQGTNGGQLTLNDLDTAIDLALGPMNTKLMLMSKRTRRRIWALLQSQQRFAETVDVKGGFRIRSYQDMPIFYSQFVADNQTQGSSSVASDLFIVDVSDEPNNVFVGMLTDLKFERLARTTSQKDRFDIFEDITLVQTNTLWNSRIVGIIP